MQIDNEKIDIFTVLIILIILIVGESASYSIFAV